MLIIPKHIDHHQHMTDYNRPPPDFITSPAWSVHKRPINTIEMRAPPRSQADRIKHKKVSTSNCCNSPLILPPTQLTQWSQSGLPPLFRPLHKRKKIMALANALMSYWERLRKNLSNSLNLVSSPFNRLLYVSVPRRVLFGDSGDGLFDAGALACCTTVPLYHLMA